jgi:hypothetical protein
LEDEKRARRRSLTIQYTITCGASSVRLSRALPDTISLDIKTLLVQISPAF